MTGPDEHRAPSGRGTGRLLVYASVALAVTAAAVLAVSSDDARLLRLGILAALWAALAGAFAAARLRRELTATADRAADQREVYRLELEREVAARREHELTVERELRRDIDERSQAELDALRAELRTLRCNLESALGGELLVERVALHAESTRLRPLAESDRSSSQLGRGGLPRRDPATREEPFRRARPEPPPQRPGAQQDPPFAQQDPLFAQQDPLFGELPSQPVANGTGRPGNGTPTGSPPSNGTPTGSPPSNGARAGDEADRDQGAHTGGRSVADLLSAYGASASPRRRRSRDTD